MPQTPPPAAPLLLIKVSCGVKSQPAVLSRQQSHSSPHRVNPICSYTCAASGFWQMTNGMRPFAGPGLPAKIPVLTHIPAAGRQGQWPPTRSAPLFGFDDKSRPWRPFFPQPALPTGLPAGGAACGKFRSTKGRNPLWEERTPPAAEDKPPGAMVHKSPEGLQKAAVRRQQIESAGFGSANPAILPLPPAFDFYRAAFLRRRRHKMPPVLPGRENSRIRPAYRQT